MTQSILTRVGVAAAAAAAMACLSFACAGCKTVTKEIRPAGANGGGPSSAAISGVAPTTVGGKRITKVTAIESVRRRKSPAIVRSSTVGADGALEVEKLPAHHS